MGDCTYGKLEVVACPPEHVAAVLAVVNDYALRRDSFARDETVLVLGDDYADDQMRCGAAADIAAALADLRGVSFRAAEDPKYEWLGDVYYQLPDGRTFNGSADAGQHVVLADHEYLAMREAGDTDLRPALDHHFGVETIEAWRRLADQVAALPPEARTLTPEPMTAEAAPPEPPEAF